MSVHKEQINKKLIIIALSVFYAMISTAFIYNTWSISLKETKDEAIQLASAAEAGIQKSFVSRLAGKPEDINLQEYNEIKNSLVKLVKLNNKVRFAYLYTQRIGKIHILVDSEPADSKDYSPPGQEYTEATQVSFSPFQTGETILAGPATDRWGTWMSVLVPMKVMGTGNVIAVFGVDYPAKSWYDHAIIRTIQAGVVVFCVFLILTTFLLIINRNKELKIEKTKLMEMDMQLKESEGLFKAIFDQIPIGVAIGNNDMNIITNIGERPNINPMLEKILGRTKEELANISWTDITHPDDLSADIINFEKFKMGKINGYSMEKRYIRPDGSNAWVNMFIAPLHISNNIKYNHLCLVEDINDHKEIENALLESERSKAVLLAHLPGLAYRCTYDPDWTMQFVSAGCYKLTGYPAESLINNNKLSFNDIIAAEYRNILWHEWERVIALRAPFRYEYEIVTNTGEKKWVLEMGQGIYDEKGAVESLEGIIIDISEQKKREAQIRYMVNHDYLTGVYNRKHYEEAMDNFDKDCYFPITVMVVDINGLRLVNESFGYSEGDMLIKATSRILHSYCRPDDVLARVGGGGFGLLLPNTDDKTAFDILNLIEATCMAYNQNNREKLFDINLSIGYATKEKAEGNIKQTDKLANESLRERKLLNRRSFHSDIITSMMSIVNEKSHMTKAHAMRLTSFCKMIGQMLNITQKSMDELELLAMLHDIGKVGIEDRILNKPGSLDEHEWVIMKRHPEIGYRIAKSSSELEPIAEYILSHHERWDGKGYPRGLKGEDIPLLSRILAVADAYDAMTEDRVYRKAMQKDAAIEEIRKNAGVQFDPEIVQICESIFLRNENSLDA